MADTGSERLAQFPRRGAGAILFSSLVHQGWKFPAFILTDSDERYLFDLEVHKSLMLLLSEVSHICRLKGNKETRKCTVVTTSWT